MTRINKLVIHGFKSFAKHTEMVFGPKYNVVLGPNGSGKSNVLDSLCFVLGKTSAKSLRAEKSSNLIYNGGKSKKPAKHGEVSIYFDNSDKAFPTEDKELKITRIVRQNGQSIYKINDNVRTREQVLDLLNMARINPDSYSIILQGDIVRFVEMPPNERRMLIEDVAGISMYEDKKRKALLELDKVQKKLGDAEIVLNERNTYLKELKKDRDQALKFKDMNEKITMYRASLLKLQIDRKGEEKAESEGKLKKANEELEKAEAAIKKLNNDNLDKKRQVEAITKEIEEKGEVEQVNLNKEVETLKMELARQNYRLDTLKNEIEKISKRRLDLNSTIREIDAKIAKLVEEKEKILKIEADKEKERSNLNKRITEFREKNKLDNLSELDSEIEKIDKSAEEYQKEIHSLREKQHSHIREKDTIQHRINTLDEQIKKVAEIEREHHNELEALKNKRDTFKKTTLELNKKLNEDSSFAAQIGSVKERLAKLNDQLTSLEARNTIIKDASMGDMAIKKVLSLEKPGIYGTVADLGNVDSKYGLSLEIAAGSRIKSVVVEDDAIAADCIKYLKNHKLGIATFLPLSKLKSNKTEAEVKELAKIKGCRGLAIDLVEFEPKFKKVFEYVFSNTLVVDNIDVARRIGIGSAKMVTLDGDMATHSGVMQGGYRDKKRKGLGFREKELGVDIDKCRNDLLQYESSLTSLETRRAQNEDDITNLRHLKATLEGEIIKTEKSLHLDPSDLEVSKAKKEELIRSQADLDKSADNLVSKISELNKELAKIKTRKQEIRSKISELRDPALLAEISAFEEKLRQTNEELLQYRSEIKNITAQTDTLYKPEIGKIEEVLKQLQKDESEFKAELKNLTGNIKSKQAMLIKKEEQAKIFYAKFKELFSKQSKINEEIQKNEVIIGKKRDESVQIEIRGNTLSIRNSEITAQLSSLKNEFSQYEGVKLAIEKNVDQLKYEITKFEKMKQDIGFVNMRALEIYDEVEREYNSLLQKKSQLTSEREDVMKLMDEIEGRKKELFMEHYNVITEYFKKAFFALSTKGEAFLELENPEHPFEGGIRIKVKISGMKFLDIRSLSGGEKTLTALAFIFAIQEHEPASFYVMDEVDAALDKHNSEKLAKLIETYSHKAQYIIISHNDSVISEAEILYGVSMNEHGMSNVVSLRV
ncbi:MAG: chromosome segregation protein SMC [Nanoarchaeota archaeon]